MIKQCFAVLLIFLAGKTAAQNNLIVLTEKGMKFQLFVNEGLVNDSAQSVVKAQKIYEDTCSVKMIFADKQVPAFSSSVFLTVSGMPVSKREFTYSLVEEKGKKKLKFISVNFVHSDTTVKPQTPEKKIENIFTDKEKREAEIDRLNEKYPPPSNCPVAISDSVLKVNLKTLKDEHIELNRMKDGKWFVSHHCLNVKQLVELMGVFDRQDSKVKIAKFAFDYMMDHGTFLETLEGVKYATEKEELKKFYDKKIEK